MTKLVKAKVADLSPLALDWLVAHIEGEGVTLADGWVVLNPGQFVTEAYYSPTSNPELAYSIIDREKLQMRYVSEPGHPLDGKWMAMDCRFRSSSKEVSWTPFGKSYAELNKGYMLGETMLIACMRFFVASKLGAVVEIPKVLKD